MWLNPARADGALIPTGGAFDMVEVDAAGRFSLPSIAPGDYRLDVQPKARFEAIANVGIHWDRHDGGRLGSEFASVPVTVNGENLDALMVQTTPGLTYDGSRSSSRAAPCHPSRWPR